MLKIPKIKIWGFFSVCLCNFFIWLKRNCNLDINKTEHMFEKGLTKGFGSIIIQMSTKQNICSMLREG